MKAGESEWRCCMDCDIEFEVTLEPKIRDMPKGAKLDHETKGIEPAEVSYCPFCGEAV